MMAQLTVHRGASLATDGINANIRANGTSETLTLALDGAGTDHAAGGTAFVARTYGTRVTVEGSDLDVYQIWIEEIPTPGTTAVLGLAGLAAIRRRR